MVTDFKQEYEKFKSLFHTLPSELNPNEVCDRVFLIGNHNGREIDLTISAIIHGNEIGGLVALNNYLTLLNEKDFTQGRSIAILLGNLEAAAENKRFLEKDLNRCFGCTSEKALEERIAKTLQPYLSQTKYLVDLHQTQSPTLSDFYIFPQTDQNIQFAWDISPNTPIVVHEKEFSEDGMCCDSFVTLAGGTGVTYEMSTAGENFEGPNKATQLCVKATLANKSTSQPSGIYIFDEIFYSDGESELTPGLSNFSAVTAGQCIGEKGQKKIYSQHAGYVLFPKYGQAAIHSAELCRVVKKIPYISEQKEQSIYSSLNQKNLLS